MLRERAKSGEETRRIFSKGIPNGPSPIMAENVVNIELSLPLALKYIVL
jgi:hypothetical protein